MCKELLGKPFLDQTVFGRKIHPIWMKVHLTLEELNLSGS